MTEIHNEKFRNRSKYQTDIFTFLWLWALQQRNIKIELSATSIVQTHCPIYYEKVRSLILVWYSGTVQSFKPQHATLPTTLFITWHATDDPDACHMQKRQCTLYSSLAQSTAGLEFSIQNYNINSIPHIFTGDLLFLN